jgi:hypothetical protein
MNISLKISIMYRKRQTQGLLVEEQNVKEKKKKKDKRL